MKFSKREHGKVARNKKAYIRHSLEVKKHDPEQTKKEDLKEREEDQDSSMDY